MTDWAARPRGVRLARRILTLALVFSLVALAGPPVSSQDYAAMKQAALMMQTWNGQNIGQLYAQIKQTAGLPGEFAFDTIRRINLAMAQNPEKFTGVDRARIAQKQRQAAAMIKSSVDPACNRAWREFARGATPEQLASVVGQSDIGSSLLPDKIPDANTDIDRTIQGSDVGVNQRVRNLARTEIMIELGAANTGLSAADFGVIITAHGDEAEADVFKRRGGIEWAKRNMQRVEIIDPKTGASREYRGAPGELVQILDNAENLAKLRAEVMKTGGAAEYVRMFTPEGTLKAEIPPELQTKYAKLLTPEVGDIYASRCSTAAGGCLDMAEHLQMEVLDKPTNHADRLKKTCKYVDRGNGIVRRVPGLQATLDGDPLLQEYADVLDLKNKVARANTQQLEALLKQHFGDTPDAGLAELGRRSKMAMVRMTEIAFQAELDRIVAMNDPVERGAALKALAKDFAGLSVAEFQALAKGATSTIDKLMDLNAKPEEFKAVKESWASLEALRKAGPSEVEKVSSLLKQTETGRKLLAKLGQLLEWANKPLIGTGEARLVHPIVEFVNDLRASAAPVMTWTGHATLAVGIFEQSMRAKDNAELALGIGHALVGCTVPGMILEGAWASVRDNDNEALARTIMYLLLPETAMPAMVGALGNATISIAATTAFDSQLNALYWASHFYVGGDNDGRLSHIEALTADYSNPAELSEFLNDLLGPGGHAIAANMTKVAGNRLIDEQLTGIDVVMRATVVESIRATVDNGNILVFRDDGPLMMACANIQKYQKEIDYMATSFGVTVSPDAGPGECDEEGNEGAWTAELSRGQKRAMWHFLEARETWRKSARMAFLEALVRTMEERERSERDIKNAKRDELYAALTQAFTDLDILDKGVAAYEADSGYNILRKAWNALYQSDHEAKLNEMRSLHKFTDAYTAVRDARNGIEGVLKTNLDKDPTPRPLTGSLPLTLDPGIDVALAMKFTQQVERLSETTRGELERIKRGKLAGDYDRDTFRKLYELRYLRDYWWLLRDAALEARKLHWTVEVWDVSVLYEQSDDAYKKYEKAGEDAEALLAEYQDHYGGEYVVDVDAPDEIEAGTPVKITCVVKRKPKVEPGKPQGDLEPVPAEVLGQMRFAWTSGKASLGEDDRSERTYKLTTVGEHEFNIVVTRVLAGAVNEKREPVGTVTKTIKVLGAGGLQLAIDGPAEGKVGVPLTCTVTISKGDANTVAQPEWTWWDETTKTQLAQGDTWAFSPTKAGPMAVRAELRDGKIADGKLLASARKEITIQPAGEITVAITGASEAQADAPIDLTANVKADESVKPQLKLVWRLEGGGAPFGNGLTATFSQTVGGTYRVVLEAWGKVGDKDQVLASSTHSITVREKGEEGPDKPEAPPKKNTYTIAAEAHRELSFIQAAHGKGATNKKDYAFHGAFMNLGEASGMQPVRKLGDADFAETWLVKIPVTIQIEGDIKVLHQGVYDDMRRSETFIILDPKYPNRIDSATVSGYPKSIGPAKTYYESNSAGAGSAWGGAMRTEMTFKETTAKPIRFGDDYYVTISYVFNEELFSYDSKAKGFKKVGGDPRTTSIDFRLHVTAQKEWLKPKDTGPKGVTLTASATTVKQAGTVQITAAVSGTQPEDSPLAFKWTGVTNSDAHQATLDVKTDGKHTVACTVTTAKGEVVGSDDETIEADLAKEVTITRTAPPGDTVTVGQPAAFAAQVTQDGKPVTGEFVYRWEPRDSIKWAEAETAGPANSGTFVQPGKTAVWVAVLKKQGDTLETVAESDHLEIEVAKPGVALTFEPAAPYIGQTTVAKVTLAPDPGAEEADIRWELPKNVQDLGESPDTRQRTFRPKDDKPVKVIARARVKGSGNDLGEAEGTVTPAPFKVTATVVGSIGAKPRVFKPGVGLVEETQALAVHQNVVVKASVAPTPEKGPARFHWTLNEDSHFAGGESGTEITVNRSQIGQCVATVFVEDADGLKLGSATAQFSVTISQKQLDAKPADDPQADPPVVPGYAVQVEKVAPAGNTIATGAAVTVAAKLLKDGTPVSGKYTYRWDPIDGARFSSQEGTAPSTSITFAKPGKFQVLVSVLEAPRGIKIGKPRPGDTGKVVARSAPFEIVIGGTDGGAGQDTEKLASAKVTSAQDKAKAGKLDEAIAEAEEAKRLDPKNPDAGRLAQQFQAEKQVVEAQVNKAKALIAEGKLAEAQQELKIAQNLHPEYAPVVAAGQALAAAVARDEANQNVTAAANTKRMNELLGVLRDAEKRCDGQVPPAAALDNWLERADEALKLEPGNADVEKTRALVATRLEWRKALDTAPAGQTRLFKLESRSWGAPLKPGHPLSFARMELTVRYFEPGVVIDQAGVGNAKRGSMCLKVEPDGRLSLQVFDPITDSPNKLPNSAWHAVRSKDPLAPGVDHQVVVEHWGDEYVLRVGGFSHVLKLTTLLSDDLMWVGDTVADEEFAAGGNTHNAMIGLVRTEGFKLIEDITEHWNAPYRIAEQGAGGVLTTSYPRDSLRIAMVLKYTKPGTILGMVATKPWTPGSFNLTVMPDGHITFGLVSATHVEGAPRMDTPRSRNPISAGVYHYIVIEYQKGQYKLLIDGDTDSGTNFPATSFSGQPMFLGAIPGGGQLGLGLKSNNPGFAGEIYFGEFRSLDGDGGYVRLEPTLAMPEDTPVDPGGTASAEGRVGRQVRGNTAGEMDLQGLKIRQAERIRLQITECSEYTSQGHPDSARVGEVEFYCQGRKIEPLVAIAESTAGGYSASRAIDGDRAYGHMTEGERGWASADKQPDDQTWIEFIFPEPVDVDRMLVTSSSRRPYQLYDFDIIVPGEASDSVDTPDVATPVDVATPADVAPPVVDDGVLQPAELPAGLSLPAGVKARAFKAPFNLARVWYDKNGDAYIFSGETNKAALVRMDPQGNAGTYSTAEVVGGQNFRGISRNGPNLLVTVDYVPSAGNRHGGLYELSADGNFRQWTLSRGCAGIGDIIPAPQGGWYFSEFESTDNIYHLSAEGQPETPLMKENPLLGAASLTVDSRNGTLYANNLGEDPHGWPFGGTSGVYRISAEGKPEPVLSLPAGQSFADIAFSRGGPFGQRVHAVNGAGKTVIAVSDDGSSTPVISGVEAPASVDFSPVTGDMLLTFGDGGLLWIGANVPEGETATTPGPATTPEPAPAEPFQIEAPPGDWEQVSYGPGTLSLPPGWKPLGEIADGFEGWYDEDPLGTDMAVWVLRGASSDAIMQQVRDNAGAFTIESKADIMIGDLAAVRYLGEDKDNEMKGWLVIVTPDVDEKGKIGFLVGSTSEGWSKADPTLRKIISTIQFEASG